MKRIITAILAAALAASVCVFAGCGEGAQSSATEPATEAVTEAPKLEELQLSRGTFMKYDPNVVTVEGYDVSANDGSWTLSIHECYDADNLAKRKEYYDKAVNDEGHTDVVTAEKQLGAYKYQTVTYTANAQYFANYLVAFDAPVPLEYDYEMHGLWLTAWMEENTPESLAAIESVISTIEVRAFEG